MLARNYAERARAGVRGALRPGARRAADEQPRRAQLPARQARGGDRRCSRRRSASPSTRAATWMRRRRCPRSRRSTCAPATSSRPRSRRVTRSRLLDDRVEDYIDEIGSAQLVLGRALLEQDRLDEAEEAFRRRRGLLRPARLRQPSRGRVGRPRRSRARRGDDRLAAHLYPHGGRGTAGRQVLGDEEEVNRVRKARFLYLLGGAPPSLCFLSFVPSGWLQRRRLLVGGGSVCVLIPPRAARPARGGDCPRGGCRALDLSSPCVPGAAPPVFGRRALDELDGSQQLEACRVHALRSLPILC